MIRTRRCLLKGTTCIFVGDNPVKYFASLLLKRVKCHRVTVKCLPCFITVSFFNFKYLKVLVDIVLSQVVTVTLLFITKTCLYNVDPLKPHFYIVKLGFTGVYIIFLISAQKHRLWVLVRTASPPRRF